MTERQGEISKAPTPTVRRYVSYVVGFGVAVGVGLAPFLGKVAGVDALLNLFPRSLHESLIPLSAFLMGLIAVAIQFYSGESLSRALLRRRFKVTWLLLLAGFFLLFSFYNLFVIPVSYAAGQKTALFIISPSRVPGCQCGPTDGDEVCIQKLSLRPEAVKSCWDSRSIRFREYLFSLSYLAVTGGFGALIGLLMLTEQARQQEERRPRRAAATPPDSPPAQGTS